MLSDLRDILESVISADYVGFLAEFVPSILELFRSLEISFVDTSPQQKLRAIILDILVKLPLNDAFRGFAADTTALMLLTFEQDNEDNALIALRFFIELHKSYRVLLEGSINSFVDICYKMLSLLPLTVKEVFDSPQPTVSQFTTSFPILSSQDGTVQSGSTLPKAHTSFKVLAELPVFLIMYFQIHKKIANECISRFVPLIFQILSIQAKAQLDEIAANPHFIGISPSIRNRPLYVEFIMLQVKALSFLAYIARLFPNLVRPHQALIPASVVQLYRNCPHESVFIRKELLVSTRHLFTNDFQKLFVPFVEGFLNESFSLGHGVACNQMIRTLLYSMLADLIHHVRMDLSPAVLVKVISVFSKNIHDSNLPINLHSMAAKLVLNLIDCLVSDKFPLEKRPVIFSHIFATFVAKLTNLKWDIANIDAPVLNGALSAPTDDAGALVDTKKETKFLLKTLISGMKNILLGFRSCYSPTVVHSNSVFCVRGFALEDQLLFHQFFRSCIECFSLFGIPWSCDDHLKDCSNEDLAGLTHPLPLNVMSPEDKEIIDLFSYSFTVLDVALFYDIVGANLNFLVEKCKKNLALLAIPQYFLAIATVSKHFCIILLKFLMSKINDLGKMKFDESQIILRLFKLVFLSVTVYPDDNEQILLPHLNEIILKSLRLSQSAPHPVNYYLLLKSLFRSIGGGRYESLYKEVLPLLPLLLEILNSMLLSTDDKLLSELFVELCLTTPVRLSALLPHLNLLMQPLLTALTSSNELVIQGLRTLELCIDNIPPYFMDPVLTPYYPALLYALWTHLKPVPYNQSHAHAAVRILGKLSGRINRVQQEPINLKFTNSSVESLFFTLPVGNQVEKIFIDNYSSICKHFMLDGDQSADNHAIVFDFCTQSVCLLLGITQDKDNFIATDVDSNSLEVLCNSSILKDLVSSLMFSCKISSLKERAENLLQVVCELCALFRFKRAELENSLLDPLPFFVECILECFVYPEGSDVFCCAISMLQTFYKCLIRFYEDDVERLADSSIMNTFVSKFTSLCYSREYEQKLAGFRGITFLISQVYLGYKWFWGQELKFVRALLYILKDSKNNLFSFKLLEQCKQTLEQIISPSNSTANTTAIPPASFPALNSAERANSFNQLVSLLISELPNSDETVRETVQSCLQSLSVGTQTSLHDLLLPIKDRFLTPILNKPLRALPFNIQISHIDAITFCLNIRPIILNFSDELLRLLHETLALADADDASLVSKSTQLKNAPQVLSLRIVCIKFLSSALQSPEMQNVELEGLRGRILSFFFKCLYSKSSEIVSVAMAGLASVTGAQQKLPKDLLQSGLRPILSNLSEPKKLSIQGLDGLSRLLQLLTGYFKAEIGKKLLDHLNQLVDPNTMEEISNNYLMNSNEINIFVGVVEVFHLLPSTASAFMEDLVNTVLSLENLLRRTESSPFRIPLCKFLTKYPQEAIGFFVSRIQSSSPVLQLFCGVLGMSECSEVCKELIENQEKLFAILAADQLESILAFVDVLYTLVVSTPEEILIPWITDNRQMIEFLFGLFKSTLFVSRAEEEDFGHPLVINYIPKFLHVTTTFLSRNLDEIPYIFELLQIFLLKNSPDLSSIQRFFREQVITKFSSVQKRTAMTIFLGGINAAPDDLKTIVFKNFVIPLVTHSFQNDPKGTLEEMLDFSSINELVWDSYDVDNCPFDDRLKIELLNFTNLLIEKAPEKLMDYKRMIIRVLWSNVIMDDVIVKQATFNAFARFIQMFEVPFRVVMQAFDNLVKSAFLPDGKSLPIKNSFDSFVPVLLEKLTNPAEKFDWMNYCRKALLEEPCHSLTPAIFLWQIMVRYSSHFDDYSSLFIPFMVNSFGKIGFAANVTAEQKMLTLELCELVLQWNRPGERSQSKIADQKPLDNRMVYVELCVNYLIKFLIAYSSEPGDLKEKRCKLLNRAYVLLEEYLKYWPQVKMNLNHFNDRIPILETATVDDIFINTLSNILQLFLSLKVEVFFQFDIIRLLDRVLLINSPKLIENCCLLVGKILQHSNGKEAAALDESQDAIPDDERSKVNVLSINLLQLLNNFCSQSINAALNLTCALSILELHKIPAISEMLISFYPLLDKLLGALIQKHILTPLPDGAVSDSNGIDTLQQLIGLINTRESPSHEQKNSYLCNLSTAIASTKHDSFFKYLFEMVVDWILSESQIVDEEAGSTEVGLNITADVITEMQDVSMAESKTDLPFEEQSNESSTGLKTACVGIQIFTLKEKLGLFEKLVTAINVNFPSFKNLHAELFADSLFSVFECPWVKLLLQSDEALREECEFLFIAGTLSNLPEQKEKFIRMLFEKMVNHKSTDTPISLADSIDFLFRIVKWEHVNNLFWLPVVIELLIRYIFSMNLFVTNSQNNFNLLQLSVRLSYCSSSFGYQLWTRLFPFIWKQIPTGHCATVSRAFVCALARQSNSSSNSLVASALLDSFVRCSPIVPLPPYLVSYLAKTFSLWYSSICYLEKLHDEGNDSNIPWQGIFSLDSDTPSSDSEIMEKILQSNNDALSVLYCLLDESDYYFGLERRKCVFSETLLAISLEQIQLWPQSQAAYEAAQLKARNGSIPFSESEYNLWENEWMECAKRLQQWDVVGEVAKIENNSLFMIQSLWRSSEFNEVLQQQEWIAAALKAPPSPPTGREPIWLNSYKKIYESFLNIYQVSIGHSEKHVEFQQSLEIAVQSALKAWDTLPSNHSKDRILHLFQLMVELNESQSILLNLSPSNLTARPQLLADIKTVLSTWRDRLPNNWDDIDTWNELLAWRQHVFNAIGMQMQNVLLDPSIASASNSQNPHIQALNSFAFRGYHESAWLINKFSHVARKQGLSNVCLSFLNKIYTLPNIEIQDAFKKLREQVKCYLTSNIQSDLITGLEIINATNLGYFVANQKAEFFTFKAKFLARLDMLDEANRVFAQAVEIDLNSSKGWSAWGTFNDERFMATKDIAWATNAISCYLQTATLVSSGKGIRKLLSRVLWLLSFEDAQGTLGRVFDTYTAEFPAWNWIPFIPQLLGSLSKREGPQARFILSKIAKHFPQALYFPLRTANEEYKSTQQQTNQRPPILVSGGGSSQNQSLSHSSSSPSDRQFSPDSSNQSDSSGQSQARKAPSEVTEELMALLKTGHPLLALSMENMVEHVIQRLRATPDEDLYRILTTLLYEGFQQVFLKISSSPAIELSKLPTMMESSLTRVSEILANPTHFASSSSNVKYKEAFDADFIASKPTLDQIIHRLIEWRSRLLPVLQALPRSIQLENFSRYLVEFEHQKYDDVEIPGQYLSLQRDSNNDFVKIDRFEPGAEIIRRHGASFRRITIRGSDGALYPFLIQNPAARHSRREERMIQLLRFLGAITARQKETRRREVQFSLPVIVPLSAHVRMLSDDESVVSMEEILEDFTKKRYGSPIEFLILKARDELYSRLNVKSNLNQSDSSLTISNTNPESKTTKRLAEEGVELAKSNETKGESSTTSSSSSNGKRTTTPEILNVKVDLFEYFSQSVVPSDTMLRYFQSIFQNYSDFWAFRKQFTIQYAASCFCCYLLGLGHRFPYKILVKQKNGNVFLTDLLASTNHLGLFTINEAVPFRLTPNIQVLIGSIGLEGPFNGVLSGIATALLSSKDGNFEVENYLALSIRDELVSLSSSSPASSTTIQSQVAPVVVAAYDPELLSRVIHNIDLLCKRLQTLACSKDIEKFPDITGPVNQAVIDLVSAATNPQKLSQMEPHWHPWL